MTTKSVTAGVALLTEFRSARQSRRVRFFTLGWVSRDPFADENWPIHDVIDTAPREVMQMPLAVQFLSSRRILLSMTLTGGLMLLGPSVLGMSGSLSLPALPAASTSSFEASSHSHGDGRPPMLKCPRFDC
ncbi:hypothetical protein ACIHDR_25960 [Nocardia sp. NPDC052278]|uniref:hypothetical protein n=1 Tax=unclassified Nocardia TaxID=2637762 RepID=UPI0036AD65B4